jgi:hypothetical protein
VYGLFSHTHFEILMLILFGIGLTRDILALTAVANGYATITNPSVFAGRVLQMIWRVLIVLWLVYLIK